jgi:serine phosphatase RsbU (regulator of sigma subunit)
MLYTDGIVETADTAQVLFGSNCFKELIKSHTALPAGQFADALIRQLFDWSGKPSEKALDDDITLIVADYQHV